MDLALSLYLFIYNLFVIFRKKMDESVKKNPPLLQPFCFEMNLFIELGRQNHMLNECQF